MAERPMRALPLAHLSLEVGHLYFEDLLTGVEGVSAYFQGVARWADTVRAAATSAQGRPRISTCFLIDDYFGPQRPPDEVIPMLLQASRVAGLEIDYLVRESACAEAEGVPLAALVEERIVAEPPPHTNGSRPPVNETGWLCNGQRSPVAPVVAAMQAAVSWAPPVETAATRHSVFVDVELWNEGARGRVWSCAYLAAVWQLLRLGALRYDGEPVAVPRPVDGGYPDEWSSLPAVIQLNPAAAPFAAYRAVSVLPRRFLLTEQAVRTILSQIAVDRAVIEQTRARAHAEGIELPPDVTDRIDYVFAGDPPAVSRGPGPTPTGP
nr:SCO2522 family protein [Planosporangium mesophilum]